MKRIQHTDPSPGQWLTRRISTARQLVQRGTEMKVHWVPGHMSVEGSKKVDEVAKKAAERTGTQRCPEQYVSLAHFGRTISQQKWKYAKHWFRAENKRCCPLQRALYDPSLKSQGPDKAVMDKVAQVSRQYFWLKSGHAVIGTYLHRIGKTEIDRCRECTSRA